MKLVTYRAGQQPRVGVVLDGAVHDGGFPGTMIELIESGPAVLAQVRDTAAAGEPVAEAQLLAPLVPRSLRDCLSFEGHLMNIMGRLGRDIAAEWYEVPAYYKSLPETVIGPDVEAPWPRYCRKLDHELELAAIIGKPGRDIPAERGLEHVFGWTIWNDMSARDVQMRELPLNLGPAKAKDWEGSNILGPCVVTADELDGTNVAMSVRVNGETWGSGNSSDMHHSFGDLIAYASMDMTLHPGEVIGSGTAPGGSGMEIDRWIAPGDVIEMEIEGIGVLRNVVGQPPR